MLAHLPKFQLECTLCNKPFRKKWNLWQHIENAHGKFKCKICEERFMTDALRRNHEKDAHGVKCEECEQMFLTAADRRQHMLAKHSVRCTVCLGEFVSKQALEAHTKAKHNNSHCVICDKGLDDEDEEVRHVDSEHRNVCWVCFEVLKTPQGRDMHIEAKHRLSFAFICKYCPAKFDDRDSVITHEESHASDIKCNQCDQGFFSNKERRAHVREHHAPQKNEDLKRLAAQKLALVEDMILAAAETIAKKRSGDAVTKCSSSSVINPSATLHHKTCSCDSMGNAPNTFSAKLCEKAPVPTSSNNLKVSFPFRLLY